MSKADNVGAEIESIKSATSILENQDGIDLSADDHVQILYWIINMIILH